jgi:hypothetical protein
MRRFLSRKPSPAMLVAFIALLAALSGSAIALPGKNTVDSGDIKNNVIRSKDIRNGQVATKDVKNNNLRSVDIRNNTVTGNDVNEGSLGQVPSANTANSANSANTANTANTANNIAAPEGFHQVGAPGEPPFLNGCTAHTLATPGVEIESPGFYKDREGRVHLKGVYACPTASTVAFQLPPGYRPANNRILAFSGFCLAGCSETDDDGDADGPNTHEPRNGLLAIIGAGAPVPNGDGAVLGDGTQMSLDGISFRAAG